MVFPAESTRWAKGAEPVSGHVNRGAFWLHPRGGTRWRELTVSGAVFHFPAKTSMGPLAIQQSRCRSNRASNPSKSWSARPPSPLGAWSMTRHCRVLPQPGVLPSAVRSSRHLGGAVGCGCRASPQRGPCLASERRCVGFRR
ncbi:hypothetical protein DB31_7867 [Hyalangium minutum]|uniref:Uncharacterized protein n=1 Tax=Hyalangium minutum TaxID=394096 RepID=A0A085WLR7_9BACT|nr:hypothetical protein DB31_7867 [Hyalangium minutum]